MLSFGVGNFLQKFIDISMEMHLQSK